jgi:hypothetical protein
LPAVKSSRDQRADPDITPGDLHIRQKLENHCEEQSNDRQREDRVEDLNQRLDTRDKAAKPLSHKRDDRCENKREKQEADNENKAKGKNAILN